MSADEDTELRDLVVQSLDANGVLGKLKAQLRASVFLALEDQETVTHKVPLQNEKLRNYIESEEGMMTVNVIREFLAFFNLESSLAVFEPELGLKDEQLARPDRVTLSKGLAVSPEENRPLLASLLRANSRTNSGTNSGTNSVTHIKTSNGSHSLLTESTETRNNSNHLDQNGTLSARSVAHTGSYDNDDFEKFDGDKSDEEIEEDILSELGPSDNSATELTTDRTVSPKSQSETADYMEDVIQ